MALFEQNLDLLFLFVLGVALSMFSLSRGQNEQSTTWTLNCKPATEKGDLLGTVSLQLDKVNPDNSTVKDSQSGRSISQTFRLKLFQEIRM